jgi:release factor glutamine methyltransferase
VNTVQTLLADAADLPDTADTALLLAYVLDRDRSWLYAWPEYELTSSQLNRYRQLLRRRLQGEPLAYLTGHKEFWSLSLQVTTDTLIPRPETELLVETALELFPGNTPIQALDLGTGSGAIAIALASERSGWQLLATDISINALQVAENNALEHKLHNIRFQHGSWFNQLDADNSFQLIISNPPYVADNDPHLQKDGLPHEPVTALTGGRDGLKDLRHIILNAPGYLQNHGWLLVEHGIDQGEAVRRLFQQSGFEQTHTRQDLEQRDRISLGCYSRPS